jgi:uncharacterized protein (DUF1810 family)
MSGRLATGQREAVHPRSVHHLEPIRRYDPPPLVGDLPARLCLPRFMTDPYRLHRFELAQDDGGTYDRAVAELRAGHKTSHWMWFVFPQVAGLGHSPMSQAYAISSLDEAQAFLGHPVLGARMIECVRILLGLSGSDAQEIFGSVDAMKLHSSMTLFARAAPENPVFGQVLDRYFDGVQDAATGRLLANRPR